MSSQNILIVKHLLNFGIISVLFIILPELEAAILLKAQIQPVVIVHGGAGNIPYSAISQKIKGVILAARLGFQRLEAGDSVLDAVEEAVRSMELDENFNAGYGAALTLNGSVEADAAIMVGDSLQAGCVSIVKDILHPISLAKLLLEKTKHSYMAGEGVIEFAKKQGFDIYSHNAMVTQSAIKALEDYKYDFNQTNKSVEREFMRAEDYGEMGTVGAVAIDIHGNIAAATSSGGITGKLPGRIGGSTILGAGTYADNLLGGVSVTGHGEDVMRFNVAQKILQLISLQKVDVQVAVERVMTDMMTRLNGTGGVVVVDPKSNVGVYSTSMRMPWAYQKGPCLHYGINQNDNNEVCASV